MSRIRNNPVQQQLATEKKKQQVSEWHLRTRHTLPRLYAHLKATCKTKGRSFELTREEFASLWNAPCSYCGAPIDKIGIDRVDSTKGYTIENCVPCCFRCNSAKNNMTVEEFKDWIKRIYSLFILEEGDKAPRPKKLLNLHPIGGYRESGRPNSWLSILADMEKEEK